MSNPRQLRQVLGRRVRELREQAAVRQEDLADKARALDLPWNRSRIAALERGEKPISVEDLVLIVALLSSALDRPVDVAELFDADESVRLSKIAEIPARALAEVLHGAATDSRVMLVGAPEGGFGVEAFEVNNSRTRALAQLTGTSPSLTELQAIARSMSEADERARRALGEVIGVYAVMCHALWGRSLSAQRDARLVFEAAHLPVGSAVLAARRGHVTRELLAELRQLQAKITTVED
ncbi:MAG: helix-turn-helix transcriptional regulator [Pseudonocardiaceae bacterium]